METEHAGCDALVDEPNAARPASVRSSMDKTHAGSPDAYRSLGERARLNASARQKLRGKLSQAGSRQELPFECQIAVITHR
ncbi:hypothetical protein [Burkholderia guangdongensis]|uniref:hypothetical protein n=1 Tax=Burkholderia guangdongensis TaxID=1792500 RepID=UPI0015C8B0C0|nr:hypothetical protein [Burkholderia guangdongensis]